MGKRVTVPVWWKDTDRKKLRGRAREMRKREGFFFFFHDFLTMYFNKFGEKYSL